MWALIDNYDSFTYMLLHYLLQTGHECRVYRNDEITVDDLIRLHPDRIILSPGPETPIQAGITMEVIAAFHDRVPILGVCLGHQALGMFFGARLIHAPSPVHGKSSPVYHNGHPLFSNIPSPFLAMRYHSLAIDCATASITNTAATRDGVSMAAVHPAFACTGVQFHPESIGTEYGLQLLKNWAQLQ